MSDPLRIALVAEGPTDAVVIEAALRSMLGGRSFVLKQVFPEDSSAFGPMGTGWVGVYQGRAAELEQAWPRIAAPAALGEAFRFQTEFLAAVPAPPTPAP